MANPLTKEAGGQPVWAWGAELVGAFIVFRWWKNRQAANAANAVTAIPSSVGPPGAGGGGATGTGVTAPQNWAGWLQQALSSATGPGYGPSAAYNDFAQWIQGGCVSSTGFTAIGNAISTLGLPPGFGSGVPAITVCSSNSTTGTSGGGSQPPTGTGSKSPGGWSGTIAGNFPPITTPPVPGPGPGSSSSAAAKVVYAIGQVVAPGEHIVSTATDAAGGQYALTNFGGVYTANGAKISSTLGGSYLGYLNTLSPALQQTNIPKGPGTGLGDFTGGSIVVTSPGHYTLTDNTGHSYAF